MNINYPTLGAGAAALTGATLTPHNHLWNPEYNNFSPKFGFAYAPDHFHGKTVIRGGFARAYNRLDNVLFDPALEDGPRRLQLRHLLRNRLPQVTSDPGPDPSSTVKSSTRSAAAPPTTASPPTPPSRLPSAQTACPQTASASRPTALCPTCLPPTATFTPLRFRQISAMIFVTSVGYQGSTGRHYSRPRQPSLCATGCNHFGQQLLANGLYIAQNDSNQYYNGLNIRVTKNYKSGLSFEGTYTYSKSEDQISSGDGADGSANQTNPQDNNTELGPSDFDVRHRITALGTYNLNYYHGSSFLMKTALNGWQANGIFTAHTGFPFTPVTYAINGIPLTPTSDTISPVRPYSYVGNNSATCSNDRFANGTAISGTFGLAVPAGDTYRPGIGRNSFRGPCYQDIDLGIAKEIPLTRLSEKAIFRFQAQAFNLVNKLNFSPFTFSSQSTRIDGSADASGTVTPVSTSGTALPFGRPQSASAGRVLEFNARISF